ncbi:MAG: OmpA family protein [Firmicutes bacterium]|nr:OmpA family protein [Bacillota bacterium]
MRTERNRRNEKKGTEEEGSPAWMTTYADMITLVLAFFVLLFSFAVVDGVKFSEALSSIHVTFLGHQGILDGSESPVDTDDSLFDPDSFNDALEIIEKIQTFIEENNLDGTMNVMVDERGIVLESSDVLFFDPGKAVLKDNALEILSYIAELLTTLPQKKVVVEGHTDNVPINTLQFASNWELSVTRAVVVVRYLVEIKQLDPLRFAATGLGEFHPITSNLTAEGRAKNRRVNIIISNISVTSEFKGAP